MAQLIKSYNMNNIKAFELKEQDIIYLGHGVIGKIIHIYPSQSKPDWLILFFSDGFITECQQDEQFEKLN